MNPSVVIVDYGFGNLHSVCKALRMIGSDFSLTSVPEKIAAADRVILPGVGAFADGMLGLTTRGLDQALKVYTATGKPLLGICLGAQLFLEQSSEFGTHPGLGLIPGSVEILPASAGKIPHVGWQRIHPPKEKNWQSSFLQSTIVGTYAYFVHSYHALPTNPEHVLATASYGGCEVTAAVRLDNITGFQFHPEKSGHAGLDMLRGFIFESIK